MNDCDGTQIRCVLCGSEHLIRCGSVDLNRLIDAYNHRYNINVKNFFSSDDLCIARCTKCDLKFFIGASPGDNTFYERLYSDENFYECDKPEFQYALDKIIQYKPATILDAGCGSGAFLKKIRYAFEAKGIEKNPLAVKKLEREGITLDSGNERYEFIVAFQVIEHVCSPSKFINSLIKKLHNDGMMLITVPNRESKYCEEVFDIHNFPPHHMTWWNKKCLENMADILGLDIIEYYYEPHRIEHYMAILNHRRELVLRKISRAGFTGRFTAKVISFSGRMLDRLLAPYLIDHISYPGHTIGVLLKPKK